MTTKCIAFTRHDGGITIRNPSPYARLVKQFVKRLDEDGLAHLIPTDPIPLSEIGRKVDPADPSIDYAETEAEFLERVRLSHRVRKGGGAASHEIIEAVIIPKDLTFRDAWKMRAGAIEIDLPRAKEIQRDHLRRERAPLLAALDVDWSRAMAKGDAKAAQEIETKRQALRDVTIDPAIDAATSPDDLKAIRAQDRLSK